MHRTGMLSGKENVEQQEPVRMSEHAAKLREARDARRKRILARSSERLAFITGEANAIPTSPLLDHKSNSIIPLSSILNQDCYYHPDQESTIKKSILFNEYEQSEAHKKLMNNRENTSKAGEAIAEPLENEESMEASKEQVSESMKENTITFKSIFSNCIKQSLFPRLICATCIALAVLATSFRQDGQLGIYTASTSTFAQSGHLGRRDALFMICYSLAIVMLVDLLLFMGAFFFFTGTEHLKRIRNMKAMANKPTFSILLHLLLSISLDCSVSASLLSGGFLVLSKYFPSNIS